MEERWDRSRAVMVKDIRPGASGLSPQNLADVNGVLYFRATDSTNGDELWKSDGTEGGTVLVKDINPGAVSSNPSYMTNVNDVLYFVATDGTNGIELWKSDGTAGGTVLVKDIVSGSGSSTPLYLTNVNDVLYFTANNGTNGTELWKSDGTLGGTVMVKDIYPGISSSSPSYLINVNGVLYFAATDIWLGTELFALNTNPMSDSTPPVTTASPTSGYAQNVSLTCDDGSGSGCAGIFYTSDGSTPTVYSQPYTGLISITETTTLKYFAIDVAGNLEDVHTGVYTTCPLWYQDSDGDGYGNPSVAYPQCDMPTGPLGNFVLNNTDPDDSDPNIYPGASYIRIGGTYYLTLQEAYDAAIEGDTIQSQTSSFTEDLFVDSNKYVTLQGGYNSDFSAVTGKTTLSGDLIISDGTTIIENFILQ